MQRSTAVSRLLLSLGLLLALVAQTSSMATSRPARSSTSSATEPPASNELFALDANASSSMLTPCADHKTCDECVAASYTCHFCEFDFQCHTIGSPMGCVTGISTCHHLDGKANRMRRLMGAFLWCVLVYGWIST